MVGSSRLVILNLETKSLKLRGCTIHKGNGLAALRRWEWILFLLATRSTCTCEISRFSLQDIASPKIGDRAMRAQVIWCFRITIACVSYVMWLLQSASPWFVFGVIVVVVSCYVVVLSSTYLCLGDLKGLPSVPLYFSQGGQVRSELFFCKHALFSS